MTSDFSVAGAGFDWVDLEDLKPSEEAVDKVPGDFALKHQLLPIAIDDGVLVVAMGSPESLTAADELAVLLQMPTRAVLASPPAIREKIEEIFLEKILAGLPGGAAGDDSRLASEIDDTTDLADLQKMAGETAVIQMVNLIFAQALRDGASDVHVEPYHRIPRQDP
jgi:type II secretory ATPase GspE/PulE/Tfp pilus assembly ATPase PilB-like protein